MTRVKARIFPLHRVSPGCDAKNAFFVVIEIQQSILLVTHVVFKTTYAPSVLWCMDVDWLLDVVRYSGIVGRDDRPNKTNTIMHYSYSGPSRNQQ
jgi:hypothetical protein